MSTDPRIGSSLAGYRIERLLGRGGMSVVYLAEDIRLERPVALKLLAPELGEDEGFRERFLWESRLAASLDHPNVIPIYEAGETDGQLFIAMRYVEGTDLRKLLDEERPLSPERAMALLGPVANALDEAHKSGLVHRDVKPGNILIGSQDHVYLSDFGITKRTGTAGSLTESGQLLGSIDYVAPEQIAGKEIDGRADQYSLACVAYEALAGRPPFTSESDSDFALLFSHINDPPPKLTDADPEAPPDVDETLARAMAKQPDERFESCREFTQALRRDLNVTGQRTRQPEQASTRQRRLVIGAAVALVVVAAAVAAALALTLGGGSAGEAEPAAGALVRIDPETNAVAQFIELDQAPNAIASGPEDVWVTHVADGSLSQFDDEGSFVRRIDLGAAPFDVADRGTANTASTGARVVTSAGVKEIDARSGGIFDEPGLVASAVDANSREIWVTTPIGIARLSAASTSGPPEAIFVPNELEEFPPFRDIALTETDTAWLIGGAFTPTLWRLDLAASEPEATIALPSVPHSIAATDEAVWVTALLDDVVWRIDPATNEVVTTIPVGRGAGGVAADASGVWVAASLDGTVTRIDPRTNAVAETIDVGGRPVDISAGPSGVWVVSDRASAQAEDDALKIGVIRDCYSALGFTSETSIAGAQLPLFRRGGSLMGRSLGAGVAGASIAGRPLELEFACTAGNPSGLLVEARRLVEGERVDVVVGPYWPDEADALHDYARRHPGITFVAVTSRQSTTLREPTANFIGANGDGAQNGAGLGAYAFNDLGWRTAAVVTEATGFFRENAAGFIAEFCALGGDIVHRAEATGFEPGFPDSFLDDFPDDGFDGLYVNQQVLFNILANGHDALAGNLSGKVLFESNVANRAGELGKRLVGTVVSAGYADFAWLAQIERPTTSVYEQYIRDLTNLVTGGTDELLASTAPDVAFFVAMEMALQALEAVDGDLSDGQAGLQAAFPDIEVDGPYGQIRLDERRRAIMPNHLLKIRESEEGVIEYQRFRIVEDVEQTFNRYFTPDSASPSATEPACVGGEPPPWAGAGG